MANVITGWSSQYPTVERWPSWFVFDMTLDVTEDLKLLRIRQNTLLLDVFVIVYQAMAVGGLTTLDLDRYNDGSPVNLWNHSVGGNAQLETISHDHAGTFSGQFLYSGAGEDFITADVDVTIISGPVTIPARVYVGLLLMRLEY